MLCVLIKLVGAVASSVIFGVTLIAVGGSLWFRLREHVFSDFDIIVAVVSLATLYSSARNIFTASIFRYLIELLWLLTIILFIAYLDYVSEVLGCDYQANAIACYFGDLIGSLDMNLLRRFFFSNGLFTFFKISVVWCFYYFRFRCAKKSFVHD